jgi:radical SAM protein with 4Fe4S-binding SPASM domain
MTDISKIPEGTNPERRVTADDKDQLLKSNPGFCLAPWMHLHILAEGVVTPCCETRQALGNINRQSFADIWNGEKMKEIRAQMLRGERVAGCRKCFDKEDAGVTSLRNYFNKRRGHQFDTVIGSDGQGNAPNAAPRYYDIRFSNICNFRCRSCWHGSSSRWFADGVALGVTAGDRPIIHGVEDAPSLFRQIDEFLPDVEQIYFAGGEPCITDEHYQLLDILIARGCTDVELVYNTNLSVTAYKGRDLLELWRKFSNVEVRASIDAIGARGELMRKEQDWKTTVENARRLRHHCPHIDFRTDTTVSVFNILHLPHMFRELAALDFTRIDQMRMHLLQDPDFYNIRILPPAWKAKARAGLADLELWFEERLRGEPDADQDIADKKQAMNDIASYMDSEDWSHLLPKFRNATARLDKLRDEKTAIVFPELAPLLEDDYGSSARRWLKTLLDRAAVRRGTVNEGGKPIVSGTAAAKGESPAKSQ